MAALGALSSLVVAACLGPSSMVSGGVGYPIGPSVVALGLQTRCVNGTGACADDAHKLVLEIAGNLGDPYDGPGITDATGPWPDGTLVITVRESPPFPWQAATQQGPVGQGLTERIAIDLTPLVHPQPDAQGAYAIVDTAAGPRRFWFAPGEAGQLLDALYRPIGP